MATGLEIDETVFVPWHRISNCEDPDSKPSVFCVSRVVEKDQRSIKINLPEGEISNWIASKFAHRNIGVAIFRIGDNETEIALLDPLAKSLLHYCRVMITDDSLIQAHNIRTIEELRIIWGQSHGAYSHVILIGHGREYGTGIRFIDRWFDVEEFCNVFGEVDSESKTFISLICESGRAAFGGTFSNLPICDAFIAPYHKVHGGVSSQFAQSFLIRHFLYGETIGVAFRNAAWIISGQTKFRMWQYGELTTG